MHVLDGGAFMGVKSLLKFRDALDAQQLGGNLIRTRLRYLLKNTSLCTIR